MTQAIILIILFWVALKVAYVQHAFSDVFKENLQGIFLPLCYFKMCCLGSPTYYATYRKCVHCTEVLDMNIYVFLERDYFSTIIAAAFPKLNSQ